MIFRSRNHTLSSSHQYVKTKQNKKDFLVPGHFQLALLFQIANTVCVLQCYHFKLHSSKSDQRVTDGKMMLALGQLFGLTCLLALNMLGNTMKIKALYNSVKNRGTKLVLGYF